MTTLVSSPGTLQTAAQSVPSIPDWFGAITVLAQHLQQHGVRAAIEEQVRCARRRFGRAEVIDVLAVLCGSATSGERPLEASDERLHPWADTFLALVGHDRVPACATLRRVLASRDQAAVESLRPLFVHDLLARSLVNEERPGGVCDRQGNPSLVVAVDSTRKAARQRALPVTADRPAPQRRVRPLWAPGSTGRTRGDIVRSRTTGGQAHTHPCLGTCGNPGTGEDRAERRRAVPAIHRYRETHHPPKNGFCSASTGTMAREPSSLISLDGLV